MLKTVFFWVFLAYSMHYIVDMVQKLDLNRRTLNHAPVDCQLVANVDFGSEDIELIEGDKSALVSSGVKYVKAVPGAKGRIFRFDFETRTAKELPLPKGFQETFAPHGMSKYVAPDGRIFLYVISHGHKDYDVIEKFAYDTKSQTLKHVKGIVDAMIYNANDLIVVGEDKFYVTNDHFFRHGYLKQFEDFFLPHLGNLVYFDGTTGHAVLSRLAFPNSPAISLSGKYLYLTLPIVKVIKVYKYQRNNPKTLDLVEDLYLGTACDNLFVDPSTGHIWSGCHPKTIDVVKHLNDPLHESAPSQVVRIDVDESQKPNDWKLYELYSDDGHSVKASASAVQFNGNMLIGTVHHKLMHCKL